MTDKTGSDPCGVSAAISAVDLKKPPEYYKLGGPIQDDDIVLGVMNEKLTRMNRVRYDLSQKVSTLGAEIVRLKEAHLQGHLCDKSMEQDCDDFARELKRLRGEVISALVQVQCLNRVFANRIFRQFQGIKGFRIRDGGVIVRWDKNPAVDSTRTGRILSVIVGGVGGRKWIQ